LVGAQLALGRSPAEIAAPDLAGTVHSDLHGPLPDLKLVAAKALEAASGKRSPEVVRAEIGAWALQSQAVSEAHAIDRFARLMGIEPDDTWPTKSYACTAIDALDGSFVLWNRDSGIGLARAVASSCAVPGVYEPISFRGRRYMDGGMRSGANVDLAKGYDVVVVVALPMRSAQDVSDAFRSEIQFLRDSGSQVEVIVPDEQSRAALGPTRADPLQRRPSAEAGLRQGRIEASRIIWDQGRMTWS
jgi:NTE family protein